MRKLRQIVRTCSQPHREQSSGQDSNWSCQTAEPTLLLEQEMKLQLEQGGASGRLKGLGVWLISLQNKGGRRSWPWRGGVGHQGAQGKSFLKGTWTLGSSPRTSAKTGAKVVWPPAGSILPGLFQFSLLQGQGHSQLAVSLQVPSTGTQSLAPVSSFWMQALCVWEFLVGGGGFCLKFSMQMTC